MTGVFDPDWVDPRTDIKPAQRPATLGEAWSANRVLARGDRMDAEADRLRREYEPILAAVNADRAQRKLKPLVNPGYWTGGMDRRASADNGSFDFASMLDPRLTRDEQQAAIFKEIGAIRQRDVAFLKDVPGDVRTFSKAIIDREKAARAQARDVTDRASGIGSSVVGFAGGVWETMHDPVNIASLPLGGGGTTLAAKIGRSALLNGALELAQQPGVAIGREQLGEELTVGEALLNTGMGAVGGVAGDVLFAPLGKAAVKAAVKGIGKAVDVAVPADRRIAMALGRADVADATDADVAAAFASRVPQEMRTPDESAAIHVIEREAEVRDSSPFIPTVEGLNAHAARMQASMEAIVRANTGDAVQIVTPVMPARLRSSGGRLANDVVNFFKAKGYTDMHARGIAAGVAAEAASNHTARNPTSGAMGLGQWLGPRKAELIRRYGPNPTRQQQLEFLHWELQGGDHGGKAVLRQGDEAGVLNAYINDFMRPAKGAETTGDLSRGMAALGREGEDIAARAIDFEGGIDAPIARPAELDAEAPLVARPEVQQLEIDYADVPELRRDLFADDAGHAAAQDSLLGEVLPEPVKATMPALVEGDGLGPAALLSFEARKGKPGVSIRTDESQLAVAVYRDGDGVAQGVVQIPISAEVRSLYDATSSYVAPAFRRQSIATRLYDALAEAGHPIDRLAGTGDLTPDGAAFINARRAARQYGIPQKQAAFVPSPALRDAIAAEPMLADRGAVAPRQLDLFDQPGGSGPVLQADSLAHDMRAVVDASIDGNGAVYRLEDGSDATLSDILADIDEDEAMIATIRSCL